MKLRYGQCAACGLPNGTKAKECRGCGSTDIAIKESIPTRRVWIEEAGESHDVPS